MNEDGDHKNHHEFPEMVEIDWTKKKSELTSHRQSATNITIWTVDSPNFTTIDFI